LLTYISFIGMTGGEIFHEMMRRHEVKHICSLLYLFCEGLF
jgi:hypothetical protein